jgi:hypothetical protein
MVATGVCIPIGYREVLLAAVYKSPGHAWNDSDITELLSLDISSYWQKISMLNIYFGTAQFPTLLARNY